MNMMKIKLKMIFNILINEISLNRMNRDEITIEKQVSLLR